MRKSIVLVCMLMVVSIVSAFTATVRDSRDLQQPGVTSIAITGGSDSNTITADTKQVCGVLTRQVITGVEHIADTNWAVIVKDENGKTIFSQYACSSASLPYSYAMSEKGADGNSIAGLQVCGALTVQFLDINCPNEIQRIDINSVATDGNFVLAYGGTSTGLIIYDANAAIVQAALNGLSSLGAGSVVVAFPSSGDFSSQTYATFSFNPVLGNVSSLSMDTTLLTGGITAAVTESKAGGLDVEPTIKFYYKER